MATLRKAKKTRKAKPLVAIDFAVIDAPAKRVVVEESELDALEKAYGELPPRYREFMSRFGPAEYFRTLYVHPLARARKTTEELRSFFASNIGLWENASRLLAKGEETKLVVLGNGVAGPMNGGWLVFVSGSPERLLVLPRPQIGCEIVEAGPTFAHAIAPFFEEDD